MLGCNHSRVCSGYESVEAGGCCLGAVLFQEVSIAVFVAAREREQRPRAQQREFVEHEAGICGYGGQSVDRRLRILLVANGSASDQQLHQNFGGPSAPDHVTAFVRAIHDCPHHFDGAIEIPGAGLLHRKLGVDDRQRAQREPLRHVRHRGLG